MILNQKKARSIVNRLIDLPRIRSAKKLSLGDSGKKWPGFVSAGLGGEITLNITEPLPRWMHSKYNFIWSERMLEHISVEQLPAVFKNISTLLNDGCKCRMSLPICYWGTQSINMMRAGNEEKCKKLGHVTWFTYKGYGSVTSEYFGAANPPEEAVISWEEGLKDCGLQFQPIRHYNNDGTLFLDESYFSNNDYNNFQDEPDIITKRPDSLIFDLVRTK